MRTGTNPFTDPAEVQGPLYATSGRLASRTSALHRARVSGRHAAGVIADIAVKSADSYRELDRLMAASGLDPAAESRPSLYQATHSGIITALAETGLAVRRAVHETHRFVFPALADAAEYLATSPKYDLPPVLAGSADALAAALAAHLPELCYSGERELRFEHVEGRHALPSDLTMLAAHLGDVYGNVHQAEPRKAELPRPYRAAGGQVLPSFPAGRLAAVERELSAGRVPHPRLTVPQARRLIVSADGPAAFYKDANPRNFLITPDGTPVTIDSDDLTLAPFGYDLAKLIVTLAMTHGPIHGAAITEALGAYNLAANGHCPPLTHVTWNELMGWAEIHHILTARYADDGRYPFPWDQARPS